MFPILNVGPLAIQAPGLIILVGLYVSFLVIEKQPKIYKVNPNELSNLFFYYLISIIILGRLSYIFRFPSIFMENPLSIISLNPSLIDFASGTILGLLVVLIYIQKKKINLKELLNAITFPLLIFLLFFFFAQLASGNFYGKPSALPWSIQLWGSQRHPLQIYYMVGVLVIILSTWKALRNNGGQNLFIKTISALSLIFVILDFFNGDPNNLMIGFNKIQLGALLILLMSNIFILVNNNQLQKETT